MNFITVRKSAVSFICIFVLFGTSDTNLFGQNGSNKSAESSLKVATQEVEGMVLINGREFKFTSIDELNSIVKKLGTAKQPASTVMQLHANNIAHFAIYASDLDKTRSFYESVFAWKFSQWGGTPDFYQIDTSNETDNQGIRGAMQKRPDSLAGEGFNGYECSISIADIKKTAEAIKEHGGKIVLEEVEIPTVGRFIKFTDPSGNVAAAIQYFDGVNK